MVSWKVQRKRPDLQSPGTGPAMHCSSSLPWGDETKLHILGQGHNSLLYLCSDIPPWDCCHRKPREGSQLPE